ncbi:Maf family protein [Neptunicella sp. SCSIO 80796]|uniref:Maf family protein n=1 Tax=Neptunicella plasticusilytica TaxID=3117012 RepID=UPI003A4D3D83
MILLASQSPRRAELLRQLNVDFERVAAEIDEQPLVNEKPDDYTLRMAIEKAQKGQATELAQQSNKPILAADTSVVVEQTILGKPQDRQDSLRMLSLLSGREHKVLCAVAVYGKNGLKTALVETRVTFKRLTQAEMDWYWESGEPLDKAGSYAIQGLGGQFVQLIQGSYSAVVGLPLFETAELLQAAGIKLHER